jgi:hypothetical protein
MEKSAAHISLRLGTDADIPALHTLIEASVRGLEAGDYSPEQIDGALGTLLGLDTQLVADGTYLSPKREPRAKNHRWLRRLELSPGALRQRSRPFAKISFWTPHRRGEIRAFFVHPYFARRGVGTNFAACESAARRSFSRFEDEPTLTGVPLYLARSTILERIEVPLPNGTALPIFGWRKPTRPVRLEKS